MYASSESVLPPAYAEFQSVCSPPYSPRPLPRPPTSTVASVFSPVHLSGVESAAVDLTSAYNDDLPDPVLPPDDACSFVPSDSDSDSSSDSEVTLHDEALIVRPLLHLSTTKVLDSTLSPVDPACLSALDLDLLLTPLIAWADVCYASSVLDDVDSGNDETGCGNDARSHRPSAAQHVFATSEHLRYAVTRPSHPSESQRSCTSPGDPPDVDDELPAPFSADECITKPCARPWSAKSVSPPAHRFSPRSSPPPNLSSSRSMPTLASPRPRRGFLSLATIGSQSPPTSDSDVDEHDGAHADGEGDGGRTCTADPHVALRGWTPPRVWTGYEAWVPVADVEETVTQLRLDFGAAGREREKANLESVALPQRVEFNVRPTSPVPGYPLLFSREPPNPAHSVHFFPKREELSGEAAKKRQKSLSRRVASLFR